MEDPIETTKKQIQEIDEQIKNARAAAHKAVHAKQGELNKHKAEVNKYKREQFKPVTKLETLRKKLSYALLIMDNKVALPGKSRRQKKTEENQ